MAETTTRLQILVDKKTYDRLWEMHYKKHKTVTKLVREAINCLYEKEFQ